jgi:PAS domain S-box-containing protein
MLTERDLVRVLHRPLTMDTRVAQVMSSPVVAVPASMAFRPAYVQLCLSRLRHLVVVDEDQKIVGIASERDFLGHVGLELCQSVQRLEPLVDWSISSMDVNTPVLQALDRMVHEKRGCIIVNDASGPVGLFTEHQAPAALARVFDGSPAMLHDVMQHCPVIFSTDASVAEVLGQLVSERAGYVIVVNGENGDTGIIAQSRLLESIRASIHVEIANRHLAAEQIRLARDELKQQLDFSGAVVDAMTDGVSVCHEINAPPYIHFTMWNPAMTQLTGYSMEEINRLGWYQTVYVGSEMQELARQRMAQMRFGDNMVREEWVIGRKDGRQRVVEISASLVMLSGAAPHVMVVIHDMTDRKKAETELLLTRNRLKSTIEALPDVMVEVDDQERILGVHLPHDGSIALLPDDYLGRKISEVFPADVTEKVRRALDESRRHGRSSGTQLALSFQGQRYWFELSILHYATEADGLQRFVILARDITSRQRTERQLRESEFFLLESQRIGQLGGFRADPKRNTVTWTEGVYNICELPLDYKPDLKSGLEAYVGTSGDLVVANLQRVLDTSESFSIEIQVKGARTGKIKWAELRGSPHFDADGKVDYVMGTLQDISERKRVEEALANAKDDAEAANRAKSAFLATMSHEIRTPMNGVLGMAQLLLMPNLSESDRHSYARTILTSGQTLLTLLNDILDLSKIEAGKFQLDERVFDPRSLVRETQTLFAGAAQTKHLQLDYQWRGANDQRYVSDPTRIRQMLSNLVGNAIKFTSQGVVRIDGSETMRDAQTAVLEFSVTDSGIGIAADKFNLLFKPFSQTDSSTTREFGGTGLGLSIVSNLAKAMGGEAGVESQPGVGSKFWFRIRVSVADVGQDSRHGVRDDRASLMANIESVKFSGRVLVVEDNPVNCMVIDAMLARLGMIPTIVNDGQQALDALRDDNFLPDLILMDIHMPVMDGYTATQHIRQWETNAQRARLPIIALTADAFEEDHQHCLSIGMNDFLTKPVSVDALHRVLSRWARPTAAGPLPKAIPLSSTVVAFDLNRFKGLVEELVPLLERNGFDALAKMDELQSFVAGTSFEAGIGEVGELLQSFRFDLALARLREVTTQQSD